MRASSSLAFASVTADPRFIVRVAIASTVIAAVLIASVWGDWQAVGVLLGLHVHRLGGNKLGADWIDHAREPGLLRVVLTGFNLTVNGAMAHAAGWSLPAMLYMPYQLVLMETFGTNFTRRWLVPTLAANALFAALDGVAAFAIASFTILSIATWMISSVRARMLAAALATARAAHDRLHAAHAELEERTRQLAEAQAIAELGSWDWDFRTDQVTWSAELYRIFGVEPSRETPTYTGVLARIHPADRGMVGEAADRARRDRAPLSVEHRVVRPSGEERIVLCRGHVVPDPAGQPMRMIGTAQDITDRRAIEARLRQREKLAAIGQLAGGVAHEINNPLSVILGFAQGLKRRVPESDALHLPVASIAREALRCKRLVQELLMFSRTAKSSTELIDLNELVRSTIVLLEARARMQDVRIVQDLCEPSSWVRVNRIQLQQVIVNLGTNALDATASGGSVTVKTRGNGHGEASLSITDSGCGIPDEIRERIFEPFFTTKDVGRGTGLGLSLVYEILQQQAGRIEVESELGKGTTMNVHLPVASAATEVTSSSSVAGGVASGGEREDG